MLSVSSKNYKPKVGLSWRKTHTFYQKVLFRPDAQRFQCSKYVYVASKRYQALFCHQFSWCFTEWPNGIKRILNVIKCLIICFSPSCQYLLDTVQAGNCSVTKQFLILFDRQTNSPLEQWLISASTPSPTPDPSRKIEELWGREWFHTIWSGISSFQCHSSSFHVKCMHFNTATKRMNFETSGASL